MVAETLTRGKLAVRIERVGRPEVKNLMLAPKQFDPVNRDLEIRDLYNMEDAFHLADGYRAHTGRGSNANLAFWDGLDGKTDWPTDGDGTHPLTELVLADYLVVDIGKPYAEQGSFLEIERAARDGRAHETCGGRALNDDVMDTLFTLLINAGNGPVIRDGVDRVDEARLAQLPVPCGREPGSARAARAPLMATTEGTLTAEGAGLELDDIQSGALHERPSPYVGRYLLLRIDDRAAGRELVRRLHPFVDSGRPSADPAQRRLDHRRVHLSRSRGAGRAAGLARQLRAGVPAGDGGARGRARRRRREQPRALGEAARDGRRARRAGGALARCGSGWRRVAERARSAHEQLPGVEVIWRQDCYQLPTGRTSFGFKDGIGQPAVEGSGIPPSNPKERPIKAGEIVLGYPDETGELPPMPTPEVLGRNGTYVVFRKLHTRVAAYRQYLRAKAASREEEALLGAKMVGRWQSGAPLALVPGARRSRSSAPTRSATTTSSTATICVGSSARPGAHARRANPRDALDARRQRQRPPPPHDSPRHELRADAARRRARGRRRGPRDHLRVRRRAPRSASSSSSRRSG